MNRNQIFFAAAALVLLASPIFGSLPAHAQQAPPAIPDPDAPNAPIPDRETANIASRRLRPAPDLAAVGVVRTNYAVPKGALFAAPEGNAQAAGTDRKEPTTLLHALAVAPSGGTVVLRGGDYRLAEALKITRAVTIQPMPNETAWIKGSQMVTSFQPDGAKWSVAWDKKLTHPNAPDMDKNNPLAMDTDMVFVDGKSLKQVALPADVVPGTFCVDTTAKKLILGSNPAGHTVEATVAVTGLDIKGKESWGTVLRGLGFAHFAERGVEAFMHDLTLENNTFAWNAVRGVSLHGDDHVLRGNTFACNGLSGISGLFTNRLLFENNRVLFNNLEGFRATWAAAGAKFAAAKNMTFRNNTFENNQAAALWFDISCMHVSVVGNTVRSNKGLGIFYELSNDGLVAFNVCEDNGVGLMLSDSSHIRVWNNTFLDNSKAVVVKDTARVNDGKPEVGFYKAQKAADLAEGATWIASANEFHNNLFAGGRDKKTVLFDATPPAKGSGSSDMISVLDHNVYARTGSNSAQTLVRWNTGGKPSDFTTLDDFRANNASYEGGATLLTASPFASKDDYHLAPGSPLLGAGAVLPGEVKAAALAAGVQLPPSGGGVPIGAKGGVR